VLVSGALGIAVWGSIDAGEGGVEEVDSGGLEESAVDVGSTDDVSRLQDIASGIRKKSRRRIRTHSLVLGKMETAELYRGWFRGG
jgi:hypothetical protein